MPVALFFVTASVDTKDMYQNYLYSYYNFGIMVLSMKGICCSKKYSGFPVSFNKITYDYFLRMALDDPSNVSLRDDSRTFFY